MLFLRLLCLQILPLILSTQPSEINVTTRISQKVSLSWVLIEVSSFEEQRDFAIVLIFSTCGRLVIKLLDGRCALSYEYQLKWCAIWLLKIFNKFNQGIPEIAKLFFKSRTNKIRYLNDFIIISHNFLVFYIYKHFYLCFVIINERNQSKIIFSLMRFK